MVPRNAAPHDGSQESSASSQAVLRRFPATERAEPVVTEVTRANGPYRRTNEARESKRLAEFDPRFVSIRGLLHGIHPRSVAHTIATAVWHPVRTRDFQQIVNRVVRDGHSCRYVAASITRPTFLTHNRDADTARGRNDRSIAGNLNVRAVLHQDLSAPYPGVESKSVVTRRHAPAHVSRLWGGRREPHDLGFRAPRDPGR